MIQQISVPREGSQPLHFDAPYSKTTWGQFTGLLGKFNTIWWRTPEVRPPIKFPMTHAWRSHLFAPTQRVNGCLLQYNAMRMFFTIIFGKGPFHVSPRVWRVCPCLCQRGLP